MMSGKGELGVTRGAGDAVAAGVAGRGCVAPEAGVAGCVGYGGWLVLAAASTGPAAPSVMIEERKFFRFIYF